MRQDHKLNLTKALRTLCLLPIVGLLATSLFAQDSGSIAKALLALRTLNGNVSTINGRLYAGRIDSSITHLGGSVNEVLAGDAIALTVSDPRGRLPSVSCGTASAPLLKDSFDDCVRTNIDPILRILFPASLSQAASGRNAGQNHAQLFLLAQGQDTRKMRFVLGEQQRQLSIEVEYHDPGEIDDYLVAFQNGFFWKSFFEQSRQKTLESVPEMLKDILEKADTHRVKTVP